MDRPRVLVVEDKPNVLKLMATILEAGYVVTTAGDGAAALALIRSAPFEVVLTDVCMPGASGFEVLRAVQGAPQRAVVVMMTAYANVPDAVAAMRLGAYDYVAKPVDADEISLVVARALEHLRESVGGLVQPVGDELAAAEEERCEVAVGFRRAVDEARDRASRRYLVKLMSLFHGNVTQAAKRAGMTRESLHRVLRKYDVRSEHHKEAPVPLSGAPEGARRNGV